MVENIFKFLQDTVNERKIDNKISLMVANNAVNIIAEITKNQREYLSYFATR